MHWPDLTLPGWSIEVITLPPGRRVYTCRRYGVTWQIIHSRGGGWRGTKFHGGQVRAELESARLPAKTHRRLTEVWNARTAS